MRNASSPQKHPGGRNTPRALRRRIPPIVIYGVLLLMGLSVLTGGAPDARGSGALILLVGVGGAIWSGWQMLRAWIARRDAALQTQARQEQKTVRRARQRQQTAQNRIRQQARQQAADTQAQRRQAARQEHSARAALSAAQRAARFERVTAEAARLSRLSDAQLRAELPALFAARGLRVQPAAPARLPDAASPGERAELLSGADMRLLRVSGGTDSEIEAEIAGIKEVARLLPAEQAVSVADVESMEQWRQAEGADRAILIARNGFSSAAVRLSQRFPLTLAEPQLLAQWSLAAQDATRRDAQGGRPPESAPAAKREQETDFA